MHAMKTSVLLLLSLLAAAYAPNTHHPSEAIWSHLKRCDMRNDKGDRWHRDSIPAYVQGSWNPVSPGRASISGELPLVCDKFDMCPLGTCTDGLAKAAEVCRRFHDSCFHDRQTTTFTRNVATLSWTWVPSNGCYFSPLTVAAPAQWRAWASGLESHEDASPMLWVGDASLQELFAAFQYLTGGATHSDFHRSDVLVNSWTLKPMTSAEVTACESSAGASSGTAETPCPPADRSLVYWWEKNEHHRLSHSKWTQAFEARASTLKTLVLSVGDSWWKEYLYPSRLAKCHAAMGTDAADATIAAACAGCPSADEAVCSRLCNDVAVTSCADVLGRGDCVAASAQASCPVTCRSAHGYLPLTGMGHTNDVYETIWRDCDIFSLKYTSMVREVAQYISSVTAFTGKVIIVTSPDGAKGCEAVTRPNSSPSLASAAERDYKKEAFWFDSNPTAVLFEGTQMQSHVGKLRAAEGTWAPEFARHAARLETHVLNISHISDMRAEARTPDSECRHLCFPGVPHHWAEMMLRMLETNVHGATDGLY